MTVKITLALIAVLTANAAVAKTRPDALTVLTSSGQKYADAKSYHIEAVRERISSNELSRDWQKELLVAVVAPDGKYRYEGRAGYGSAILVSNGKMDWSYHIEEKLYTQLSVSSSPITSAKGRVIPMVEMATLDAKHLVMELTALPSRVKVATLLADQVVELNGRKVSCYVIHVGTNDFRKAREVDVKSEETLWIEKSSLLIAKSITKGDTFSLMPPSGVRIPIKMQTTTLYSVVKLDQPEPPSSFTFIPPADAKLVESFPNTMMGAPPGDNASSFIGKQAPEIQLKSPEGKLASLTAFRGKPVIHRILGHLVWPLPGPCARTQAAIFGDFEIRHLDKH